MRKPDRTTGVKVRWLELRFLQNGAKSDRRLRSRGHGALQIHAGTPSVRMDEKSMATCVVPS
jgi:hypothetical protein